MLSPERLSLSSLEHSQSAVDFGHRFVQRWDLYARQLEDGCYICVHEPLTIGSIQSHLDGSVTLGTYLLDRKSQSRFMVIDADDEETFARLTRLTQKLEREDVPSYLETSRRGGHLWFFFSHPLSGRRVRDFGRGILELHGIDKVELFPKQNELTSGPGSLIRLPFGKHRRSGQRYGFITADGDPIAPTLQKQLKMLSTPRTVPDGIIEVYRSHKPAKPDRAVVEPLQGLSGPLSERIKKSMTALEFISQYVDLKATGNGAIGLCPFHDDQHPSFSVNDQGNYWHCFAGCGGGSIIDFWMKWKGTDFTTAVRDLAETLL
jgi:hypothetical protein